MLPEGKWRTYYDMMTGYFPDAVEWHPPAGPFYTAYKGTIFAWDQYFEAVLQAYMGFPMEYAKNAVKIFLSQQKSNGHGPRSVRTGESVYHRHNDHIQPFLCVSVLFIYNVTGSMKWLTVDKRYEKLKKYLNYWLDHEDRRGAGLSVWQHTGATGMDNLYERAGRIDINEFICEGTDLNSYIVRECKAMTIIAELMNQQEDAEYFREQAKARAEAMRKWLWNEEEGIFYDYHAVEKRPIKVKCVSTFAPLWAGVATPEQAERLVKEHLLNENEFWRPYPIPALAASEPGYVTGYLPGDVGCSWRAHTWAPTNYYTFQGLRNYGYMDEAQTLAEKSEEILDRNPFCEYYSSEYNIGAGRKPFYGWTGLFMYMRAEMELGVDATKIVKENNAVSKIRKWVTDRVL